MPKIIKFAHKKYWNTCLVFKKKYTLKTATDREEDIPDEDLGLPDEVDRDGEIAALIQQLHALHLTQLYLNKYKQIINKVQILIKKIIHDSKKNLIQILFNLGFFLNLRFFFNLRFLFTLRIFLHLSAPILKCPSKEFQYGRIWLNLVWKKNNAPKVKYALF